MSEALLQFGIKQPGKDYPDRPAAFGVLERQGAIALVHVAKTRGEWWDLPGGALDPGEDDAAALVREFAEETGLTVRAGALLMRADQYLIKSDGQTANNRSGHYLATLIGEDASSKIEDDHTLEWWPPLEALKVLRHDSHAWAVACWMRQGLVRR